MAWIAGLRRRVRFTAAVSMAAALAALAVALGAAADGREASRVLSGRLVPAADEAGGLASDLTLARTSLREYVVDRRVSGLRMYRVVAVRVPRTVQRLAELVRGNEALVARLAGVQAAQEAWVANFAAPELAAAARGDWAAAQRLQLSEGYRRHALAVVAGVGQLQARITIEQGVVTDRLRRSQTYLLVALAGTVAVVAGLAAGGVVAVRRWLLVPFTALRRATDAVAAGAHEVVVPTVGPTELAELGRSVDTMRLGLLAAEHRFRDLMEASPEATIRVGRDGSVVLVNAQAERLFGYSRDELVGQPVEVLVPEAARAGHPAHRAAYLADPQFRPMGAGLAPRAVHRDGHEFPVEVSLSAIGTDQGLITSAVVRDITDRLAAQAERERLIAEAEQARVDQRLAHTQRLESLGQLVGGVAHDFNNLLNVILGYTAFIAEQATDNAATDPRWETTRADVEQVHAAAERAARLTHQLLAFGRRETTKAEVLNLNTVVTGVEQLLRRTLGEHVDLITDLDPDLRPVLADPGHLEQVLVNLAVNARDAMPSGGKLAIDTDNIDVDAAYAAAHPGLILQRQFRGGGRVCGSGRGGLGVGVVGASSTRPRRGRVRECVR